MKAYKISTLIILLAMIVGCSDEPREVNKLKTAEQNSYQKNTNDTLAVTAQPSNTAATENTAQTPVQESIISEANSNSNLDSDANSQTASENSSGLNTPVATVEASQVAGPSTNTSEPNNSVSSESSVETMPPPDANLTEVIKPTRQQARKIQQALADAGFNPGIIDGILGAKTMRALKKYQQQHNLVAGQITRQTLQTLAVIE